MSEDGSLVQDVPAAAVSPAPRAVRTEGTSIRTPSTKRSAARTSHRRTPIEGPLLPRGLSVTAAWAGTILLVAGCLAVLGVAITEISLVIIPLLVAIVLGSLMVSFRDWPARRLPCWASIVIPLVTLIAMVSLLVLLIITEVRRSAADLQARAATATEGLTGWLSTGPLQLSEQDLEEFWAEGSAALEDQTQALVSGALQVGSTVGHVAAGNLLVVFCLILILLDGRSIWTWCVRLLPRQARSTVDGAGLAGWSTLSRFGQVQILVAVIDAAGIGLGAALLGVPLALPIAVVVFFGSFIPVVGAVVTGAIAVLIPLIYNGWVIALIMVIVVLVVQHVEGHVLLRLIMGNAASVHPLAVVLSVAAGGILAGIPGAFFAVPLIATANSFMKHLAGVRGSGTSSGASSGAGRAYRHLVPDR